jgi:hypothetical protein
MLSIRLRFGLWYRKVDKKDDCDAQKAENQKYARIIAMSEPPIRSIHHMHRQKA